MIYEACYYIKMVLALYSWLKEKQGPIWNMVQKKKSFDVGV